MAAISQVFALVTLLAPAATAWASDTDWGENEPSTWSERRARRHEEAPPLPPLKQRRFDDDPGHVAVVGGFGTFVGLLGVAAGYNFDHRIELGAGIGLNAWGAIGGPYVRLRPVAGTRRKTHSLHALSFDVALSAGEYHYRGSLLSGAMGHTSTDDLPSYDSDLALWLHVEPSWEVVNDGNFALRLGAGLATLLNPSSVRCTPAETDMAAPCGSVNTVLPVVVVGVGPVF